jgi:hypothetical protein
MVQSRYGKVVELLTFSGCIVVNSGGTGCWIPHVEAERQRQTGEPLVDCRVYNGEREKGKCKECVF